MIGERIRERRLSLGMKQAELSELTGIKATTLSNYENNVSTPNEQNLYKLMEALKCDANYLFEWDDEIDTEMQLTKDERALVKNYRFLDSYGKEAVNGILNIEYSRCKANIIDLPVSFLKASAGVGEWLGYPETYSVKVKATPEAVRADIIIPVSGDSMLPKFNDGDPVLVRCQPDIDIGEIGIFIVDNCAYIKKKGIGELISVNPAYNNITGSEFSDSRCFGKVLGVAEIIDE